MGLSRLIRRAVKKLDTKTKDAQEDIRVHRWLSEDELGAVVYAPVEIHKGFHTDYVRALIRGASIIQTRHKVRFLGNVTIDTRDRIEVSVPVTAENPTGLASGPIVDIRGASDPAGGRFYTTVILGA
jgi:hypothetical protein